MRRTFNSHSVHTLEAVGGFCCLIAGFSAALVGSVLTASAWFVGVPLHPWLHALGTALLVAAIPLMLFAGFCLDWAENGEEKPVHHSERSQRGTVALVQVVISTTILAAALLAPNALHAQQTIFNVPSTDVLDAGKVYGELDVSFKAIGGTAVGKFSAFVPRIVVGVGDNVELGLNVTGNIQPGADTTTMVPAIKWKPYQGESNGIAIVAGTHLFIPARNRTYKAGNYSYAEISKTFTSGLRLTAGGYNFTRNVVAAANRGGGQFGLEQPLSKKVTFAADWITGKHSAGYFTPGFVFKVGPKTTGYAGYSIRNQNPSRGNHFFLLELGYNFN